MDVTSAPVADPLPIIRDVLLRDGATLRLQAPTPADFEDIKAFYDGLSPESQYFRFHGSTRTDGVARAEAEATGVDRFALIGRLGRRVVSVASYDGLRERGVAEVAFAVADAHQRRATDGCTVLDMRMRIGRRVPAGAGEDVVTEKSTRR